MTDKKKFVPIATLTIHGLPKLPKTKVAKVAAWMHRLADEIEKAPGDYSTRFRARFMS